MRFFLESLIGQEFDYVTRKNRGKKKSYHGFVTVYHRWQYNKLLG